MTKQKPQLIKCDMCRGDMPVFRCGECIDKIIEKKLADERAKTLKEVLKYSRSNQVVSLYEVNIWLKAELKKLEY